VWAGVLANRVVNILAASFGGYSSPRAGNTDISTRAPAHYSRRVREILDTRFPDRWIGRGGSIAWPARSPDLNVLDYFVWSYIKAFVEHLRDGTQDQVRNKIIAAFQTTPDMVHRTTRQISRRAELCLQMQGRHFEQLLH